MIKTSFDNTRQDLPLLEEKFADEDESIEDSESLETRSQPDPLRPVAVLCTTIALVLFLVSTTFALLHIRASRDSGTNLSTSQCENPSVRHEWRTLSSNEKKEYIDAVLCLAKTPSLLERNQTLYDDFPWIHNGVGKSAHHAAPFLAWHRYFLHIYESQLRSVCNYSGSLVFFDWQLNVHDLPSAEIWDPVTGFGGDGDSTGIQTVNEGRCVTDGPFANLSVLYYEYETRPHCISRGFQSPEDMVAHYSDRVSEEAIAKVMARPQYGEFNLAMEHGPHIAMPHGVLGDFLVDTAPNDPVFFLHHAQLDRLWWKWQQEKPERLREYNGESAHRSGINASLQDQLEMGGLAPAVAVEQVIETKAGLLCYEYAY